MDGKSRYLTKGLLWRWKNWQEAMITLLTFARRLIKPEPPDSSVFVNMSFYLQAACSAEKLAWRVKALHIAP